MRFHNKRTVAVAAALTLALGGGVAYAYWTTSGSGDGDAVTGTDTGVTVTQDTTVTGLYPGGPAVPLDFTITNPGPSAQFVTNVVLSVVGVPGCAAGNFAVAQPTITPANLAVGGTPYVASGASVRMIDTGVNQDTCKNVTVTVHYAVS